MTRRTRQAILELGARTVDHEMWMHLKTSPPGRARAVPERVLNPYVVFPLVAVSVLRRRRK